MLKLLPFLFVLASCAKFEPSVPDPTKALVYVYRVDSGAGPERESEYSFDLYVDGEYKYALWLNHYFEMRLRPGTHNFQIGKLHAKFNIGTEWIFDESSLEINLEAGRTYFVEISFILNRLAGSAKSSRWAGNTVTTYTYRGEFQLKQKPESQAIRYLQSR